jgi:hypothetical protein
MMRIEKIFDDPITQAIYERGQRRIDEMKRNISEEMRDGMLPIPFRCYGCDEMREDFCLMTGDGLPLCAACFEGCVGAIGRGLNGKSQ